MGELYKPKTAISMRIKGLREKQGLNQSELARKIGVTPQLISRIESGKLQFIRRETAEYLAEVLLTTPEYIMYGDGGLVDHLPQNVKDYISDPKNLDEIIIFVKEKELEQMRRELENKKKR